MAEKLRRDFIERVPFQYVQLGCVDLLPVTLLESSGPMANSHYNAKCFSSEKI